MSERATISRDELRGKIERGGAFVLFEVLPEPYYRKHHLPRAFTCRPTTSTGRRNASFPTRTPRSFSIAGTITDRRVRTLPGCWRRRDTPTCASTPPERRIGVKPDFLSSGPSLRRPERADRVRRVRRALH